MSSGDKPATKPTKAQASPDKAVKQPVALKPLARSTNHLPVKTTKPLKQVISPKAKAADPRGKKGEKLYTCARDHDMQGSTGHSDYPSSHLFSVRKDIDVLLEDVSLNTSPM